MSGARRMLLVGGWGGVGWGGVGWYSERFVQRLENDFSELRLVVRALNSCLFCFCSFAAFCALLPFPRSSAALLAWWLVGGGGGLNFDGGASDPAFFTVLLPSVLYPPAGCSVV